MLPDYLLKQISRDDLRYKLLNPKLFVLPKYNPRTHYIELTKSGYFNALITMRHYLKMASDYYFGVKQKAKNVDLFMLTLSISSPIGHGSDSEAIPIKFGDLNSNLVDSSQFGFEPLLINGFDKVYCYLPSMRGENPNKRHLNQFFHCEAEIIGSMGELIPIIEGYIKILSETLLSMPNIFKKINLNYSKSSKVLNQILDCKSFLKISFDDAVTTLVNNHCSKLVRFTECGRDISSEGENKLTEILNFKLPFWIENYDRDRVAFYQKPHPYDSSKVINADLLFPSIIKGAFGGEIVGCGQRQDNPKEMLDSLQRQNINPEPYYWYINLRKLPRYKITSGFGLGIERFITWALCRDDIKDSILYPRLKNIKSYP